MPNYKNGKVYEIVCNITGDRYIGSTTLILSQRLVQHRSLKCSSKVIIERNDYYINLLESCPCENKDELRMCERKWYDNLDCINQLKPFISDEELKEQWKEYRIVNADKIKQYYIENADKIKQYQIENADKIKKRKKQYCIKNADKIKQYQIENADKIKQYYIENADKLKFKRRERYLKNKLKNNELLP